MTLNPCAESLVAVRQRSVVNGQQAVSGHRSTAPCRPPAPPRPPESGHSASTTRRRRRSVSVCLPTRRVGRQYPDGDTTSDPPVTGRTAETGDRRR